MKNATVSISSNTPACPAGYLMRFRKDRSFMYSLIADGDPLPSPPLEQIARAQIELGESSIVRFQLTPTRSYCEELARRRYRRRENKRVRQGAVGTAGARSVVDVQRGGDGRGGAHPETAACSG